MHFAIYLATAAVSLWLIHRFVLPVSRAAAVVLLVLPLGVTGYALLTGGIYGPIEHAYQTEPLRALKAQYGIGEPHNPAVTDVYAQMFPWRRSVQAAYERGEWPLWDPYSMGGHLLAGSLQSAPFSPFTLVACLLPAISGFSFTAAIALFIAGAGAFLFARELECGEGAALVAAIGWMYAGSTVLYIHTAMGFTMVYIPLLFMAVRRIAHRTGVAATALLTVVLTLMVHAGHPETMFLAVLTAGAYGVFEMTRARRPLRVLAAALGAGVIALLLSAIVLLPFAEGLFQSAELEIKRKYWAPESRAMPGERVLSLFATDLFPFLHVRYWQKPAFGWNQAETAACGSIILAFAVYAICRRRSPETWFFGILGIVCAAIANRWGPAVDLIQKIPVLDYTHHERLAFIAALSLVILSALGLEHMLRNREDRVAGLTLAAMGILLATGTYVLIRTVELGPQPSGMMGLKIAGELLVLVVALVLLTLRAPQRALIALLIGTLLAQRLLTEGRTFETWPAKAIYPPVPIFAGLSKIHEPFRIVGQGSTMTAGITTFYGFEDIRGYEALTFYPFVHTWKLWCTYQPNFFNRVDDLTAPFLSFLNVRFAVVEADAPVPAGWRVVARQEGSALLENGGVIERVFVPRIVRLSPSNEAQVAEMAKTRDFRETAWITAPDTYQRQNGPGRIAGLRHVPGGEYRFDAVMEGDGWVVISDVGWAGWRAYIDGRRVRMQGANSGFLGLYVPKGKHSIRVKYLPDSFVRGRTISLITLALVCVFGVARKRMAERVGFEPTVRD
jgi:hypothetical protein